MYAYYNKIKFILQTYDPNASEENDREDYHVSTTFK